MARSPDAKGPEWSRSFGERRPLRRGEGRAATAARKSRNGFPAPLCPSRTAPRDAARTGGGGNRPQRWPLRWQEGSTGSAVGACAPLTARGWGSGAAGRSSTAAPDVFVCCARRLLWGSGREQVSFRNTSSCFRRMETWPFGLSPPECKGSGAPSARSVPGPLKPLRCGSRCRARTVNRSEPGYLVRTSRVHLVRTRVKAVRRIRWRSPLAVHLQRTAAEGVCGSQPAFTKAGLGLLLTPFDLGRCEAP